MTVVMGQHAAAGVRPPAGEVFLEGLLVRDYAMVAGSLAPDVKFRALLPSGPREWEGAETVVAAFRSWFGDAEEFTVLNSGMGEVGGRTHLSWCIRLRPPPFGIGADWHVIEQHAFTDGVGTIGAIDLMCSGFRRDSSPAAPEA